MTILRQAFTAPRTLQFHRRHRTFAGRAGGRTRKSPFIPRLMALEARTLLATLVVDPAGGPGIFTTIQAAVDAANTAGGDTIDIHPATYMEQVTIGKSLTMMGTGPGTTIRAPSTLTPDTFNLRVLVEVNSAATVTMSNLTIAGPAPNLNAGILIVQGATADVAGTTVTQIQDPATFGNQTGSGIQIGGTGSQAVGEVGHATITGCTVTAYQKVGIIVGRSGSTGTIADTVITGVGPTPMIAQNGIQIGPGSASGTVSNTTISGNHFTGTGSGADGVESAGVLNFISTSSVTGSTITDNDLGVSSSPAGATAAGLALGSADLISADVGATATGPGAAVTGNTLSGNSFENLILRQGTSNVTGNTITGSNIGISLVAGGSVDTVADIESNTITNNGNGGLSTPGGGIRARLGSGATTTVQATVHFNRIVGNSVGLANTTAATVDATLNWWGSNAGPNATGSDTTSGAATTSPWLVLTASAAPAVIGPGGTAVVTADLTTDSAGATHAAAPFFPDHTPIAFSATGGTIAPASVPTASGKASSSFTSTAAGAGTASATLDSQTVTTPISVAAISFAPPPPSQATASGPFSQSFAATGGAGGFTYAVSPTGGRLPPGLTLNSATGILSGTPTTPGTYTFTVTATDASGASSSVIATTVVNPTLGINPITPPQGAVGSSYSAQLSASGGTAPAIFALAGGTTLPPGLALSPAGLISGIPTSAGTFAFTITATDSNGAVASQPLSIVVTPASRVAAPTVQNLQRFGFHAQPTKFVLTFSTALDPATAQDVANYRLNPVFGHGIGRAIRITAAIYDPTTHTVTLQPARRLNVFGRYHLVVNGSTPSGVAGATGLLLDGRGNGVPGTDYVATFGKEILAGPNNPPRISRRSLHHQHLPTTTHASSHQPTGSTAMSRNQTLSAPAVDAVLTLVVRTMRHEM
jgi:hypothetical protein